MGSPFSCFDVFDAWFKVNYVEQRKNRSSQQLGVHAEAKKMNSAKEEKWRKQLGS